jgi:hypothetical protein
VQEKSAVEEPLHEETSEPHDIKRHPQNKASTGTVFEVVLTTGYGTC